MNLRKNLFLPTKKVIGYRVTKTGRHTREYDKPCTPADRVKGTGILLPPERLALEDLCRSVDLAELGNRIQHIQEELIRLAAAKTYSQGHAA